MSTKVYTHEKPFPLESGNVIHDLNIAYHTFGTLNETKSNVIWICHALTANSNPIEWWPGLVGENLLINPNEHFIVCANVIGSCYGTTGPLSLNKKNTEPYFHEFYTVTIRDFVNAHIILSKHLGLSEINTLIGGSLGGQQALEWAITEPQRIKNLVVLATNAVHSPWGVAFNESQRLAIKSDSTFYNRTIDGGKNGLKAARSIALLSYRTYDAYTKTQTHDNYQDLENFKAASYQKYQGEKLAKRFNAFSYEVLTKSMDSHNVGRNRVSIENALGKIRANTLVISIDSDILFPKEEQTFLAKHIPNAKIEYINSIYGHDGFLIETDTISGLLEKHIEIKTEKILTNI